MTSNRYNLRAARGYKPVWIDPQEVSDRIDLLVNKYRYTYASLSEHTGLPKDTICRLRRKDHARVKKATSDKVMRVPLRYNFDRVTDKGIIVSVGAARRIEAMQLRGFTLQKIHELCGVDIKILQTIRDGKKPTLQVATHNRIGEAHRSTLLLPDPKGAHAQRTRREALRKGYQPSGVWNDIDDPDELPESISNPDFDETVNRMRTLRARGFLVIQMEENSGISKGNISKMTHGTYTSCKPSTLAKLQRMCETLEQLPDPKGREHDEARRTAARKGWKNLVESG